MITDRTGINSIVRQFPGGLWSVTVTGGEHVNPLQVGMTIIIQGLKMATEKPCFIPAIFITGNAGNSAEFFEHRVPRDL